MGKFLESKFAKQTVNVPKRKASSGVKKISTIKRKKREENLQAATTDIGGKITENGSEFQDLQVNIIKIPNLNRKYLKLNQPLGDLFAYDELNACYHQYFNFNLIFIIFDEIALEGLDGITLEAFWKRLKYKLNLKTLPVYLLNLTWKFISKSSYIQFYELPEARGNLTLPNRNNNDVINLINNNNDTNSDNTIYKLAISTKESGEWGSCVSLKERINISEKIRILTLDEVNKLYSNNLVIVADEILRKNAIFDGLFDSNQELMPIDYCLLEAIGRTRDIGEATLGSSALINRLCLYNANSFNLNSKSIYHYCKKLRKANLISRQYCMLSSTTDQPKVGRLFNLRKFYRKRKCKNLIMVETIVDYLKKCPDYKAICSTVKGLFAQNVWGKLFKTVEFNKFFNTNIHIPYREYYPDSTYKEYMTKSLVRERTLQFIQLKDPYVNISACWNENDESSDDEGDVEDEGDEEDEAGNSKNSTQGRRVYNKDFIRDVHQHILSNHSKGFSMVELWEMFDIDFLTLRLIIKKLTNRRLIQGKKYDIGRQTVLKYFPVLNPQSIQEVDQEQSKSVLERLKSNQKKIFYSTPKVEEILNVDLILTWEKNPNNSIRFRLNNEEIINTTENSEKNLLKNIYWNCFKLSITIPAKILQINYEFECNFSSEETRINFSPCSESSINKNCKSKSDLISKAFLLGAFLDDLNISSTEIINFLDPDKSKVLGKRPLPIIEKKEIKCPIKVHLGIFMGTNAPQLVSTEFDETYGVRVEIYCSKACTRDIKNDISQFVNVPVVSDRILARIQFILKKVQTERVFEEKNRFLKLIQEHERKNGYDKRMDQKSLQRIFQRLVDDGYLKIFFVSVTTENLKKSQTFVCHPKMKFTNTKLQNMLMQFKESAHFYVAKITVPKKIVVEKKTPQKSPFVVDDVQQSIDEISKLTSEETNLKSNCQAGRFYGKRPKFARLALLHELVFYLVYELNRDLVHPLAEQDVVGLFHNNQITMTTQDIKQLPTVYANEISWKTFISPLPFHSGWEKGWALFSDILLRIPIILIARCYSINFVSKELQEILQHPIKRFYLLKDLSPNIRLMIMFKRKFIWYIFNQLETLAYCGLIQFGPSSFNDKEKLFFYLNRKASLWDTTSSAKGYQYIEEKKTYPTLCFYFEAMNDVLKYWSTMNNIAIRTNLSSKSLKEIKQYVFKSRAVKPCLQKVRKARNQENVEKFDTGEIPGDRKGACGLDSSLWSHKHRNWYFFAAKSEHKPITESIDTLKWEKVDDNKRVAFDQLKISTKYYLAKPQKADKNRKAKIAPKKSSFKVKFAKVKSNKSNIGMDAVDKIIMRKTSGLRYRPSWSKEEDKILILLKIASVFVTPGSQMQKISYGILRDILHLVQPASSNKTSRSVCNRIKLLFRTVAVLSNTDSLITNLYKLVPIAKYFLPFRKFVMYGEDTQGLNRKFKFSDPELNNAFIFLAYYFIKHQNDVEIALMGRYTNIDYFNRENCDFFKKNLEQFDVKEKFYIDPENEFDIYKSTLKNTIHSALSRSSTTSPVQTYKVYQQFREDVLRSTLQEMRVQRMVQVKKRPMATFFTPYRLSIYYIYAQSCTFLYPTMEGAWKTLLTLEEHNELINFQKNAIKYGQMFAMNEILNIDDDNAETCLEFNIPEYHLVLNPNIEDHSEVVDELAKRYLAKLKSEDDSNSAIDNDADPEIPDEVILLDDEEPIIDLKLNNKIDNLKNWIENYIDCDDDDRVRSSSPDLIEPVEIKKEIEDQDDNNKEHQLTLEEIKEEMLKLNSDGNAKRLVPYISDLTKLISMNFDEIENDERGFDLIKKHFVQQYPIVEKITVQKSLLNRIPCTPEETRKKIWLKLEKASFINSPSEENTVLADILTKSDNKIENIISASEILSYIESKKNTGATGSELLIKFPMNTLELQLIIEALIEHNFILKTGICTITFVHYKYQNTWLINTFNLNEEISQSKPKINVEEIDAAKWYKIKPLPWHRIDGSLDKELLKLWLSQLLSYCIENPKVPFIEIMDKFCYIKPIDLFYLLEILTEIGCLEIKRLKFAEASLFSTFEYQIEEDCNATFFDKFDEIYAETNITSFIKLGSFLLVN